MLKKLTIRNFKAIQDMTIEFTPLTVLIGENSCGKSTILQAIDFLRSAAFRDIPEYLREKGWSFNELKSYLNDGQKKEIEFISSFEFNKNNEKFEVEWYLFIDIKEKKFNIRELICIDGKGVIGYGTIPLVKDILVIPDAPKPFEEISIESSLLKIADDYLNKYNVLNKINKNSKQIIIFKDFLLSSSNLDVLSPEKIKNGVKQPNYGHLIYDIGINGENLAQCIENMSDENRLEINKTLSEITNRNLSVRSVDRGNRIDISLIEKINDKSVIINSPHICDGFLRLIAFSVISLNLKFPFIMEYFEPSKNGMILLDEIENGINPYLTEKIITLLRNVEKLGRQILITTHSPVILNDISPEEIVFLWKDKNGSVHAKKFFDTKEMQEALAFLNPGEIWENFGKDNILSKLGINLENR